MYVGIVVVVTVVVAVLLFLSARVTACAESHSTTARSVPRNVTKSRWAFVDCAFTNPFLTSSPETDLQCAYCRCCCCANAHVCSGVVLSQQHVGCHALARPLFCVRTTAAIAAASMSAVCVCERHQPVRHSYSCRHRFVVVFAFCAGTIGTPLLSSTLWRHSCKRGTVCTCRHASAKSPTPQRTSTCGPFCCSAFLSYNHTYIHTHK